MHKRESGFAHLILLILLSVAIVAGIGYYAYKNGQIHLRQSFGGQVKITPMPTIDETANWKTHSDTSLNISFKYPPDWIITNVSPEKSLTLHSSKTTYNNNIDIVFDENPDNLTPEEYIKQRLDGIYKNRRIGHSSNYQEVTFSNLKGTLVSNIPEGLTNIILIFVTNHDNKVVRISLLEGGEIGGKKTKSTNIDNEIFFDQFLSTFKFTN